MRPNDFMSTRSPQLVACTWQLIEAINAFLKEKNGREIRFSLIVKNKRTLTIDISLLDSC